MKVGFNGEMILPELQLDDVQPWYHDDPVQCAVNV